MKYIRTEDGIKAYDESCDLSYVYQSIGGIKIADTIEELCDELVFVFKHSVFSNHSEVWHLYHERTLEQEIKSALDDGYRADEDEVKTIYGAIWTDKGLQFVARMNSEGVLELL